MDTNNLRPAKPGEETTMETGDWRAQLQLDARQNIVNRIIEILKKHLPFSSQEELEKLKIIAVRFEERIYSVATDQTDYLRKISLKMLTMETKYQNSLPNTLPSSVVGSSGKLQDPGVLHNVQPQVNNQGQSLPIPLLVNQSQGCQHLVSQNMQNNMASSGVQSSAGLASALPTVLSSNQSSVSGVVGQNTNMQNVSGIPKKLLGNSMRQGVPTNIFANQGQMPVIQQASPQQQQPSQKSEHRLYQQLMKQKFQQGNLPHTLMQQQRHSSELINSLDSTELTTHINIGDWQEDVHQKIKAIKEAYYLELNELHQKVAAKLQQYESLPQRPKTDQLEKLKIFKTALEQIISFLHVSKINITPIMKDKLNSYEKQIINIIMTNSPTKHIPSQQQGQLPQPHMQPMQQSLSQIPEVQSHESQVSPQLQRMNLQGSVPAVQQNNMTIMQHNSLSSMSGIGTSQQMMNAFQTDLTLNSGDGNMVGSLQMLKQQQQQLNQQLKEQLPAQMQICQMPQLHQLTVPNEPTIRQRMGVKPGVFQQHLSSSQLAAYPHQQMKAGGSFPISSPQMLPAASSQIPQHSSPQVDQQDLLSSLINTGIPLQSANSPVIVPSPSTPLVPSPALGDSEKAMPVTPSLSNSKNVGQQQTIAGQKTSPSVAINTPGIPASPLLPDGAQDITALATISSKSNVTEQPFERLIKAINSMSPEALGASVSDIGSVVCLMDSIVGPASGTGSRAAVGEDLVATTNCRLQQRNFIDKDGMSDTRKMQCYITATPLNVVSSAGSMSDSYKQLAEPEASDMESTAMPSIKRPRIEANHALLEEIWEINQRLIGTVVNVSNEDVNHSATAAAPAKRGEGTIVKCSFSTVALSPSLKSLYASSQTSLIQPLKLLVPANYPNCSPVLLDKLSVEVSNDYEDLSAKAKLRLSASLRSLSHPMSLSDIARTWDVCTRAVISEYAQQSGGGTFSSKHGTWENRLSGA